MRDLLLEDFIDDFSEEEIVDEPEVAIEEKTEPDYGILVSVQPDQRFLDVFNKLNYSVAHKAKIAVQTAKYVRHMKIDVMCVKNNEFVFYDVTDKQTYGMGQYKMGQFRCLSVKFDLSGGKTGPTEYINALSGIYEAVYKLIYYAYNINLPAIKVYLSNYIAGTDENSFSVQMFRQWKRFGYIPQKYENALLEVINNTFVCGITAAYLHRAYNTNGTIYEMLFRYGMSRSTVDSMEVTKEINPGREPEITMTVKPGKEVCIDDIFIEDIADEVKASSVRIKVEGTLVIKSFGGYGNLKCIDRRFVNNCLRIETRLTPTLIDWILKRLAFKEIDLSKARVAQEIEIVMNDPDIRHKETHIIPCNNIKVS